jgi:hypothetical protein
MHPKEFRTAVQAVPFQPFIIRLADGRELDVEHQDFVFCEQDQRTAIVSLPEERFMVVDLLSVASLEYKGAPSKS